MRLVLVPLSMTLAVPARAEWVKYRSDPPGTSYYGPTTIEKRRNMVRVWILFDGKARIDGQQSRRAPKEFDCKEGRQRSLRATSFSAPMRSGEIDSKYSFVRPRESKDVVPGFGYATLQSIVCE